MKSNLLGLAVALALSSTTAAQFEDFKREGAGKRQSKDELEGKAPPALQTTNWMNTKPLRLEALKGKVVVLDFWGTW